LIARQNKNDKHIEDFRKRMLQKMDDKQGEQIWRHFQRFAEYADLRELYKKVVPQIAIFE